MGLNCTEFYEAVEEGERVLAETDAGFGAICVAVFVVSAALLVDGERLVRPLGGLVGATVGGGAVLVFANDTGLPCEVQLGGAAVAALLLGLLAMCLLKTGIFLVGAAGAGAVAHLVYEALPLSGLNPPFVLFGLSGWYFAAVGGASVVGAVVSLLKRKSFVRVISSIVGAGGIAALVHLVAVRVDPEGRPPHAAALLATVAVCTPAGVFAQRRLKRWREGRKRPRTEPKKAVPP